MYTTPPSPKDATKFDIKKKIATIFRTKQNGGRFVIWFFPRNQSKAK